MFSETLGLLFGRAIASGLFAVNAGTNHVRYQHQRNPRLNRSRHWPYADSYKQARRESPYPERPVR